MGRSPAAKTSDRHWFGFAGLSTLAFASDRDDCRDHSARSNDGNGAMSIITAWFIVNDQSESGQTLVTHRSRRLGNTSYAAATRAERSRHKPSALPANTRLDTLCVSFDDG